MDTALDEDFVNFESMSQTCGSAMTSGPDDDIRLLDKEASQRQKEIQGGKNNDDPSSKPSGNKMKSPNHETENRGDSPSEYHLFTTFSYNSTSKRLTMIPVKYKIKEERRKVLKISVNKLKKIDDPESWLCRSVLINNTMKKLQKETRDEKMNKQLNAMTYSKTYLPKATESEEFASQNNNNSSSYNNNNNLEEKVYRVEPNKESECFYEKDLKVNEFYKVSNSKSEEFLFQPEAECKVKSNSKANEEDKLNSSISGGVSINEDFVEKIPSIKRCASRKKSVDEDGPANEILNLNESELGKGSEVEDVDDCDVHDVLSQLYMPPTPRMLTSIDSDTDDDELNVVDIDSSYIDNLKPDCPKLPNDGLFENGLLGSDQVKRECEETESESTPVKRRKLDDVFNCFNDESYDNFLCNNRTEDNERTSDGGGGREQTTKGGQEEEVIELEDEEDIKRRLSQSLSNHYHRKVDKNCESFFEDTCDNQYSCGHTVTMFNDMQSVTFHNLIASLET